MVRDPVDWRLLVTMLAFVAVSVGALYMAVSSFRGGVATRDGLGGLQKFKGFTPVSGLAAFWFAAFGVGGLFVASLLARDLIWPRSEREVHPVEGEHVDAPDASLGEARAEDPEVAEAEPPPVFLGSEAEAPMIGEVRWDPKTFPAQLPAHGLVAVLDGTEIIPETTVWDRQDGVFRLGAYVERQEGCTFERWKLDGFAVRLGEELPSAGTRYERVETGASVAIYPAGNEPDLTGAADVQLPGEAEGTRANLLAGAVAVEIDAVEESAVRGRVYVASRAEDRSLLVGAFTARRCDAR